MTDGGTYTLIVELAAAATVEFGVAGERSLPAGWYAYTGSAQGSGGFARVERHYRLAAGEHDARHWHVDSLLGHPDARIDADVRSRGVDAECPIAEAIARATEPVPGIGATDSSCGSHLACAGGRRTLSDAVRQAHDAVR